MTDDIAQKILDAPTETVDGPTKWLATVVELQPMARLWLLLFGHDERGSELLKGYMGDNIGAGCGCGTCEDERNEFRTDLKKLALSDSTLQGKE